MSTTLAPTPHDGSARTPAPAPASAQAARPARPVTFRGVLRSEWVKLRSVRSTTGTLAATAGMLLFVGAVASARGGGLLTSAEGQGAPSGDDPTSIALTGTIRPTMTMVPRRLPVLWAKALVLTAVALPVVVVSTLAAFLVGQVLLGAGGAQTASTTDPDVLRAVLGTAVHLTGVAVLGLAVGTLLRYLPSNAATSFTSVAAQPGLLGAGAGAVVFAAWVVVPLGAAAVALVRRPV